MPKSLLPLGQKVPPVDSNQPEAFADQSSDPNPDAAYEFTAGEPEPFFTRVFRYFCHPFFGATVGILGLFFGIYFYFQGIQKPGLTFYISPSRASLVKSDETNELKVSFGGAEIQGDVSAVQIAVWNSGKKPITPSEIRSKIVIEASPGTPILKARLRKSTRVSNSVEIDDSKLAAGQVGLSWHILEENDGFLLQLLYNGDTSKSFLINGEVVGQRSIKEVKFSGTISTPDEQLRKNKSNSLLSAITFLVTGVLFSAMLINRLNKSSRTNRIRGNRLPKGILFGRMLIILIAATYICIGGYALYQYFQSPVPFEI